MSINWDKTPWNAPPGELPYDDDYLNEEKDEPTEDSDILEGLDLDDFDVPGWTWE